MHYTLIFYTINVNVKMLNQQIGLCENANHSSLNDKQNKYAPIIFVISYSLKIKNETGNISP